MGLKPGDMCVGQYPALKSKIPLAGGGVTNPICMVGFICVETLHPDMFSRTIGTRATSLQCRN